MTAYNLQFPLNDEDITKLQLGDLVYLSGTAFTCRSRLQKYIFDEGHSFPFSITDINLLIHVGPVIRKVNSRWKLISFMPTSSIRFEKWGPKAVREWNLKIIIGKTTMGSATAEAMAENKCIHVSPQAVCPNLWIDAIEIKDAYLRDELGSIEAPWILELIKLGPFIVDIDSKGNNYFEKLDTEILENKKKVYRELKISDDFKYTKLY